MVVRFLAWVLDRLRAKKPTQEESSLMAKIAKWEKDMREYEALEMKGFATRCREQILECRRKLRNLRNNDAA